MGGHSVRAAAAAILTAALTPAAPATDVYPLEEETDREYGMDLVQLAYDRDARAVWDGADRGVRFAMGSLNVRQWYFEPEVKFAAPFTSWLRFLYRFERRQGLEPLMEERYRSEFELESRVWRWFYAGLRVDPAFWKREADGGVSLRFRLDRTRYLDFGYTALDFDNNYSFERSAYDEGYTELYREPPRRYEVAGAWHFPGGLAWKGEGFIRTTSVKNYTYFDDADENHTRRYNERYVTTTVTQPLPAAFELFATFTANRWEETRRYTGPPLTRPPLGDDYDGRLTLHGYGGGVYYQPAGRHRWRAGFARRYQTRNFRFTGWPYESYDYAKGEYVYDALWRVRAWRELYVETGYLGERERTDRTNVGNGYVETKVLYDNRLPIALEYKFGPTYSLKMASGLDLDRRDWGAYLIYDKAYVHVVACF